MLPSHIGISTEKYAVYSYPQQLIKLNSNLPIFVGSPRIFLLTQDVDCGTVSRPINGKQVPVRQIEFNDKAVEIVRFGDVAEVKVGLQTGENRSYLYQNPEARGTYRDINQFRQFMVTEDELKRIASDDQLRMKIIEKGFHKTQDEKNFDPDRWFGGLYIVPYDKGGESDTASGWLPNYYVPTNYFIDWSAWAVHRMKTLTMFKRDGSGSKTRLCSRFQNADFYFKEGLTLSYTGIYAPTFRVKSVGVFDVKGSSIDIKMNYIETLGILATILVKHISKVYIYCGIDMQVDAVKEIPMVLSSSKVTELVETIIEKQKQDPRYPYHLYEQKEIDRIVYNLYGLNEEDIREVETWYARRYPKLVNSKTAKEE